MWLLLFADDAIVFAPSAEVLKRIFSEFAKFCK